MACLIPRFEIPARILEEELMVDNLEKETPAPLGLLFYTDVKTFEPDYDGLPYSKPKEDSWIPCGE
jgi:hypothetical protein